MLIEQLIAVMKKRAEDISKLDPTLGGYAWRKINYLGDNPTLKMVMSVASDIVLLSEKAGLPKKAESALKGEVKE
jgi:hypothetical protein